VTGGLKLARRTPVSQSDDDPRRVSPAASPPKS